MSIIAGIAVIRPLLGVAKRRLVATLRERGVAWIEDPSNACETFGRVRLRRAGTDQRARQAQFARNFHQELVKALPGSKSLIVHPGGMRTGFLPPNIDPAELMDPGVVARVIWDEMEAQDRGEHPALHELHVLREKGGVPRLERGPKAPH